MADYVRPEDRHDNFVSKELPSQHPVGRVRQVTHLDVPFVSMLWWIFKAWLCVALISVIAGLLWVAVIASLFKRNASPFPEHNTPGDISRDFPQFTPRK